MKLGVRLGAIADTSTGRPKGVAQELCLIGKRVVQPEVADGNEAQVVAVAAERLETGQEVGVRGR
jgi:hypothetical protein